MAKKNPKKTAPKKPVLSRGDRSRVYPLIDHLDSKTEQKMGLQIPLQVYYQDPLVAKKNDVLGIDDEFHVKWEPGLDDGPTSARFAVVDYNADSGVLTPPAVWKESRHRFQLPPGIPGRQAAIDEKQADTAQFRQVNCWAVLQKTLSLFEAPGALGRRIPWAFEGNRLIVVPQAGYGENAFYDRESKSLQFYYFGDEKTGALSYTCLSTDIVAHEFGHALLDGIRPGYLEAVNVETQAFHEFMGDLTAMVMSFSNSNFRSTVAKQIGGDLSHHNAFSSIAEEFGEGVVKQPYLRSARNRLRMQDVSASSGAHHMSQVLTGTIYEILRRFSVLYLLKGGKADPTEFFAEPSGMTKAKREARQAKFQKVYGAIKGRRSVAQAFRAIPERLQNFAVQPLDLLPPVDVTFRDYALAVLRAEALSNPTDPEGYRRIMADVFVERGILTKEDREAELAPQYLFDPPDLDVPHDADLLTRSHVSAYQFLNDNRRRFMIPKDVDFSIAQVYTADKVNGASVPQRRQIVVLYHWREDIELKGPKFGKYQGEWTTLPCGGTLVFDTNGNVLSHMRKPGSVPIQVRIGNTRNASLEEVAARDEAEGARRREAFEEYIALRILVGDVGDLIGSAKGFIGARVPPLRARHADGTLRFELAPHLGIHSDEHDRKGGRRWQISS